MTNPDWDNEDLGPYYILEEPSLSFEGMLALQDHERLMREHREGAWADVINRSDPRLPEGLRRPPDTIVQLWQDDGLPSLKHLAPGPEDDPPQAQG